MKKMMKFFLVVVLLALMLPNWVSAQSQVDCYALNDSLSRAVPIYAAPSTEAEQVDTLDIREYRAVALINTRWVLVYNIDGTLSGWLDASALVLSASCTSGWQANQSDAVADVSTDVPATIQYPHVNLRQEPSASSTRLGQAQKGDELVLVGQANTTHGTWYLAEHAELGLVWVRSDLVTADNSTNLMVIDARYVDAQPVVVESASPSNTAQSSPPSPANTSNAANLSGSWQHVSTLNEHGCNTGGYPVGTQTTINLDISQAPDQSTVTITYATGYQFTLYLAWQRAGTIVYVGTYNQGRVQVEMTFSTSTSYTANETITHESGCIVKSSWVGHKL